MSRRKLGASIEVVEGSIKGGGWHNRLIDNNGEAAQEVRELRSQKRILLEAAKLLRQKRGVHLGCSRTDPMFPLFKAITRAGQIEKLRRWG